MPPITNANRENADILANLIKNANIDVAQQFNISFENNPKHPSFYTPKWGLADIERGECYFIYSENGTARGCVAFEQPNADVAYLNRLSVLPEYRQKGVGEKLVSHVITHAKAKQVKTLSIGIIAEHLVLKSWYLKLGFIEIETRKFPHLPFAVTYLHYML